MRFYTSGNWWPQAPPEIHALPLDLLKTTAYPGQPGVAERGVMQLEQGYNPIMVPQRMSFTKWKNPGYARGFGQNVVGMLQAVKHRMHVEQAANRKVDALPTADFIQAAQNRNLTQFPPQNFDPNLHRGYIPLARGVVPANTVVDASRLNQLSKRLTVPAELSHGFAARSAMESVQNTQRALAAMSGHHNEVPWFMR
jgi:hypothetical protein